MDDNILRSNNTTTDSFLKPYLITHGKSDTEKDDEQSQTKRKYSNTSNYIEEQSNKRRCKAEKFEAIQYSIGPNEEYIAIRSYEYDIKERNKDNMSKIYQDIFQKKDNGWKAILEDSLPPKEKSPGSFTIPCYINNICFEKTLADLGASVSVMPLLTFTNLGLGELAPTKCKSLKRADKTIKRPKSISKNVLVGIDKFIFPVDFVVLDMPKDIKVPLILERPFLSTAHAKINVFKRKITLRVGDDKIVFKSDNLTSNIIKRFFVLGLRERMKLDLEARLVGEALILNRSLDMNYGEYIELNYLNEPLELRINKVEDLGLTIEDGEVIDEPMEDIVKTRNDEISKGIEEYPSFYNYDENIHMDYAYNLQFSCMIGVENMDAYRDEGMGDVIAGKPFCIEVCVKSRRFDGMITIYNGNDSVTYQMAQSHPSSKVSTKESWNFGNPIYKDAEDRRIANSGQYSHS
ncbi:lysophospholipid acyltransferase 1-like protein [Tanacetum coccineum]